MNLSEYEELIIETSQSYCFSKINNRLQTQIGESQMRKTCFLRHDIDFSPNNALVMAEIESKHGVESTYTVLLSGEYYSPFEKETRIRLREIKSIGHEVGLHFDPAVYDISSEDQLDHYISREKNILEDLLEEKVEMFSFHNTTAFSMSCRAKMYGAIQNAYSNFFHNEVEYTSDSNGYWRHRTWQDLLKEGHQLIQILTHPIWWKTENKLPPLETVVQNSLERFCNEISDYTALFDGQDVRHNKSALSEHNTDIDFCNNAKMLNSYAQFPRLLNYLLKPSSEIQNTELVKIAEDFLRK